MTASPQARPAVVLAADEFAERAGPILVTILIAVVATVVLRWALRRASVRVVGRRTGRALERMAERTGGAIAPSDPERVEARAETLGRVLANTGTVLIWATVFLVVLGELDVNVGPLLAGAGVIGVALGFGAQEMVRDYLSGFFIIVEDQYGIGDVVDLGEAAGTVEEVNFRATRLRDLDGVVWHVPNGELTRVGNKSKQWARALVDVSVAYDSDLRDAMRVILATAEVMATDEDWADIVLEPPEMWGVEELAADGVTLRLIMKTRPGRQFAVIRELHVRLKEALDEAGIEIPFPQRTMWLRQPPSAEGG